MISIIICSRGSEISELLIDNIRKTIGVKYDLIVIDNSLNKYSIFEAYNEGIALSNTPFLVFIHDDILFHTENWGKTVLSCFRDNPKLGLIGVAGTTVKSEIPSGWWNCPDSRKVINIVQHFDDKKIKHEYYGFKNGPTQEVVIIDGVFMAMRKVSQIQFSPKMSGFHNYDINISMEFKKHGFLNYVTNEILIEHFSLGNINSNWIESTYKIHNLYNGFLPINNGVSRETKNLEVDNAVNFILECLKFNRRKIAFIIWVKLFSLKPNLKFHYNFLKKIVKTGNHFNILKAD